MILNKLERNRKLLRLIDDSSLVFGADHLAIDRFGPTVFKTMVVRDQKALSTLAFYDLVRIDVSPLYFAEDDIADLVIRCLREG